MSKRRKKAAKITVVMCGSGTGGHITPVLAVAKALKAKASAKDIEIVFIGQSGDKMADLAKGQTAIDKRLTVMSGKWRRYHGEGLRQLLDIPTMFKNFRDVLLVFVGFLESLHWLRKLRPTALFIKGGGIGVPVGLAAAVYKIPIITHDSDALPGLANRIIAKWVTVHTVAMPPEFYSYPKQDTVQVGIPIDQAFTRAAKAKKPKQRTALGLKPDRTTVLIFGGSLGARRMNNIIFSVLDKLLEQAQVVHIVGQTGYKKLTDEQKAVDDYTALPFVRGRMPDYMAAADVVIMRSGATALAEVATVGRPMILIPNDLLTGGHQTENAKLYEEAGAALSYSENELEADPAIVIRGLQELLKDKVAAQMVKAQSAVVKVNPANEIAGILEKTVNRSLRVREYGQKKG